MNPIGIMQGRLSSAGPRIQAFPLATWREEFIAARALGFDRIEWVVNRDSLDDNPLLQGAEDARGVIRESGVGVDSICADCFIEQPLVRVPHADRAAAARVLQCIVDGAAQMGASTIVMPFLEGNQPGSGAELIEALDALGGIISDAQTKGIRLAIESDLAAEELRTAIERTDVDVCYDIGNAASSGRDIPSELSLFRDRMTIVHIKDRARRGPSMPLGQGAVDFASVFATFKAIGYNGPLILETPRGDVPVESARAHLAFVKRQLLATAAAA